MLFLIYTIVNWNPKQGASNMFTFSYMLLFVKTYVSRNLTELNLWFPSDKKYTNVLTLFITSHSTLCMYTAETLLNTIESVY